MNKDKGSAEPIRFSKRLGIATCSICGEIDEGCCIHEGWRGKTWAICNLCVRKLFGYGKHYGVEIDIPFSGDSVMIFGIQYPWTLSMFIRDLRIGVKKAVKRTCDPIEKFLKIPSPPSDEEISEKLQGYIRKMKAERAADASRKRVGA